MSSNLFLTDDIISLNGDETEYTFDGKDITVPTVKVPYYSKELTLIPAVSSTAPTPARLFSAAQMLISAL